MKSHFSEIMPILANRYKSLNIPVKQPVFKEETSDDCPKSSRLNLLRMICEKVSNSPNKNIYQVCEEQGITYQEITRLVPSSMKIDPIKFFKIKNV